MKSEDKRDVWIMGMFFAALVLMVAIPAFAHSAEYRASVLSVYDGDTLTVSINGQVDRVRVQNIDTPELAGKCSSEKALAVKARDFARDWANLQKMQIALITGKRERDKYGRLLAYVRNERGEDLGEKLIEAGLAVRWAGKRHQGWCNR